MYIRSYSLSDLRNMIKSDNLILDSAKNCYLKKQKNNLEHVISCIFFKIENLL